MRVSISYYIFDFCLRLITTAEATDDKHIRNIGSTLLLSPVCGGVDIDALVVVVFPEVDDGGVVVVVEVAVDVVDSEAHLA